MVVIVIIIIVIIIIPGMCAVYIFIFTSYRFIFTREVHSLIAVWQVVWIRRSALHFNVSYICKETRIYYQMRILPHFGISIPNFTLPLLYHIHTNLHHTLDIPYTGYNIHKIASQQSRKCTCRPPAKLPSAVLCTCVSYTSQAHIV